MLRIRSPKDAKRAKQCRDRLPTPSLRGPGIQREKGPSNDGHIQGHTCPDPPSPGLWQGLRPAVRTTSHSQAGTDNRVLENKKPIQGTGPGGPTFRCMISALGNPAGLPAGLVKPLMTHVQDTNHRPPGLQAWPTPRSTDSHSSPERGTRRVGPRAVEQAAGRPLWTLSPGPTGSRALPSALSTWQSSPGPWALPPGTRQPTSTELTGNARQKHAATADQWPQNTERRSGLELTGLWV